MCVLIVEPVPGTVDGRLGGDFQVALRGCPIDGFVEMGDEHETDSIGVIVSQIDEIGRAQGDVDELSRCHRGAGCRRGDVAGFAVSDRCGGVGVAVAEWFGAGPGSMIGCRCARQRSARFIDPFDRPQRPAGDGDRAVA
ncbi:hypothetical protein LTT66_27575 [Nocardia gipuzkoensis]|nr:hypothetical protein [Nocardia gipuzkoensis]UGT66979.1 hypothetical protein LTT66_27575 [Nocardia gipuzkoensis]